MWLEVVRVLRRLRRAPRFSAVVILSLGIAVGPILVTSEVFEAVFLRGMAVKAADRLFTIRSAHISRAKSDVGPRGVSFPDYQDLRTAMPPAAWRYMTAWKVRDVNRTTPVGDESVRIATIAGDYFPIANARFVQGHSPVEPEIGIVITSALWRDLAANGEGAELTIYNQRYRVVGVVDNSFRGLYPNEGIDAWIPISALPRLDDDPNLLSYRELEDLSVVAQAAGEAGARTLTSSATAISAGLSQYHDGNRYGWHLEVGRAQPGMRELLRTTRGQAALAPLLVLLCVLLIAATNVANLFVIRAAARETELQLRLALGIPRRHLLLYECLEPIILGLAGLALGLWAGTVALRHLIAHPVLARLGLQLSAVSVAAACGAALLFVGICVLMPVVRLGRLRAADIIHQGQGITSHGASRLQRIYLILQFTLALAFTCVAVQLASAVREQSAVDVGFDTKNLMVVTGVSGAPNRTPQQWINDYNRATAAVSSIRGVVAVSASVAEFFGGYRMSTRPLGTFPTAAPSSDDRFVAEMDVVGPGYFATLGLPIRTGREFGDADQLGMPVTNILVNQTLAKRIARNGQPLGMTLYENGKYALQIIGIVPDVRASASERVGPVYYRSLNQTPLPAFILYARVAGASPSYAPEIVAAIVKELPESVGRLKIHSVEEQRQQRDLPAIVVFWLTTGLAAMAMLVTGLGLYGTASFAALARRKEHGIRAALGASPRQLASTVFGEGFRWTIVAAALSLPFVWVGMRVATALVVGAHHIPLLTTVALVAIYFVVVFLALMLPAHRVASTSPSDALRAL